ncbi:MAG: glycosyltransferase [Nitrospinota bacterium]
MNQRLRIMTFNWHESYIYNLAKSKHRFFVRSSEPDYSRVAHWDKSVAPIPPNVRLISEAEGNNLIATDQIDLLIAHNFNEQSLAKMAGLPSVLIFHNSLSAQLSAMEKSLSRSRYLDELYPVIESAEALVFTSKSIADDWSLKIESTTINPGIDTDIFTLSSKVGHPAVLREVNLARRRNTVFDHKFTRQVLDGFRSSLTPTKRASIRNQPLKQMLERGNMYNRYRVFLHITNEPYEDGLTTTLLEAMSSGASIVSNVSAGSPIIDGVNGFASNDPKLLNKRIIQLFKDEKLAKRIGSKGRQSVLDNYSIQRFENEWDLIIQKVAPSYAYSK